MFKKWIIFCCVIISSLAMGLNGYGHGSAVEIACAEVVRSAVIEQQDVFVSGEGGYHTYRIPSIVVTGQGTLLAFCEGRKDSRSDTGDIDLLLKRSTDNGKTWGKQQVVWDDEDNTCGNPCVVVDEKTGTIFLFSTWNLGSDRERDILAGRSQDTRRVFVLKSEDDGLSWSQPKEITESVKAPQWRWYATGPGVGIQLRYGSHKGRLVIPANHSFQLSDGTSVFGAHVIYSDDGGDTWQMSDPVSPGLNESQVVELTDGTLILNSRNYLYRGTRALAYSTDGGKTWPQISYTSALIEPRCQASVIRYATDALPDRDILLFSNPNHAQKRVNMSVKLSDDKGDTWPVVKTLHEGPTAYSCLAVLQDGRIACFYESGQDHSYEKIVLAAFTLDWLRRTE